VADELRPTPCEEAVAWLVNLRVASGVSQVVTGRTWPGALASIGAMVLSHDRGLQNLGALSPVAAVLTLPGSVAVGIIRSREPTTLNNPRPCCASCGTGGPCEE